MLISTSAVFAADNNTDFISINNNDGNDILDINNNNEILTDGNDGSFADLNTTINGDSSTNIILDRDYTYSSSDTIKTGIIISKNNTVIDGQGHTIDAKSQTRVFNITATTVILKNINFINGYTNRSGGAIYGYGDNLRVINCTFEDNYASSWGGAIFSYPNSYAAIVNSTFINNTAKTGGAVSAYNYIRDYYDDFNTYGIRHDIVNCTFDSNHATDEGGAINILGALETDKHIGNDYANIRGCLFTNNEAPEGSAIANSLSAYINITDSVILGSPDNLIYSWGAMFFADNNWWGNTVENASTKPGIADEVTFNKWLFFDFVPHIETSSASVSINNLYDSNTGEITTYSTSKLPLVNVELSGVNVTFDDVNINLNHFGESEVKFALSGDSVLTAKANNAIISKKIKVGGLKELELLIANADDDSLIKLDKDYVYTEGVDNKIGVAISGKHNLVIDGNGHSVNGMGKSRVFLVYDDSSDITFKNIKIVSGYSDDGVDGAGAYIESSNIDFINCTFLNNRANGYSSGAALHVNGRDVRVIDCNFMNNAHLYSTGGAISWNKGEAYIINSIFENNSANFTYAGAIILHNGGDVKNCTFIHNSAGHAGAIFNYNSINISDCTFISNIALTDDSSVGVGGAIDVANANIINSKFYNNTAQSGAAIYIMGSDSGNPSLIDKCIFVNNTASNGIVISYRKESTLVNSIFIDNNIRDTDTTFGTYIAGFIYADYNWFGHVQNNYTKTPMMRISNGYGVSKWLFLNATTPIYTGNNLQTNFTFLVYDINTKMIVQYDADDLPSVNLRLSGQNLTLNQKESLVGESINGIRTSHKGNLIAEYETVKCVLPFLYQEESYFIVNSTFNVDKGQSKYLGEVVYPFNDESMYFLYNAGRITFTINDTSIIKFDKTTSKITGLKVGVATITFKFDGKNVVGADLYKPANVTVLVIVSKAESRIINSTSAPSDTFVGDGSNFIVSVVDSKNRSIKGATLEIINNNPDVLNVFIGGSNIQYKTLAEGLANITVKYAGNDEYLPASRDFTFQVGRKDPNIKLSDENISITVSHDYLVGIFTSASDNFTYISNDTSVAIMDEKGVHGIGGGVANITIRFGGDAKYYPAEVYLIVNVISYKTHIDINETKLMYLTDSEYINAVVRDETGKFIGYASEFSSNDTSVVNISENCRLDAVGLGKAIVTIKYNGHYEYEPSVLNVLVTVETATNNINVVSDVEIQVDQRVNLNATLDYGKGLFYESTNSSIVTVDSRGYIKGIKTGEANITITYKGTEKYDPSTKNVTVRVVKVPTEIDVPKSLAWIIGENDTLNATLNPKVGELIYKSNDENIVKIDSNGKVTAVSLGKTTIEVSYKGSEKYAPSNKTIEVNVFASYIPTSIEVNESFELYVDDSIDMGAVLNPENAGELTYLSSDENIVKVDSTGKITAIAEGKVNITISFAGNNAYLANSTTVLVTVSLIPTTIDANESISVNKTESAVLDYVFSHPEAGQVKTSFSNPSIAHIENGKIIGDKVGKTILLIKFDGNNKYTSSNATIEITVTDVETSIDVADVFEINVTESENIAARLNPEDAGRLKFIDYDTSIISIDTNGKVTGLKLGSTNVTISFSGEGKYRSSNKTISVVVKDVETTIDAEDIEVNVTETTSIAAKLSPQEAGKLHFSTNDNDIIFIDEKGNVKGLKVGTASVLISFDTNGKYRSSNKTIKVIVSDVATEIKVGNDNVELIYGDETNINATLTPNESGKLVYSTNDSSVITIDENGNIKAIKSGVANVTISYEGEGKFKSSNKTVIVTVKRAPSSISIVESLDIEIGVAYALKPTTDPRNIKLTYDVSDNETLLVDDTGFIQSLKHGSAILTISFAGDEYYLPSNATVNVTVKSIVTEIQVNNNVTIGYGESKDLGAKIFVPTTQYPIDGKLKYVSSNPDIVSVDENVGLITANDVGKAIITITYGGNHLYESSNATVSVEVTTRTTSIAVAESSVSLYVDDNYSIKANLLNGPEGASLSYISNSPNVAFVNPFTGEITARGEGKATVTVRYAGDEDYHSSETNITVTVSRYKTQVKSENTFEMEVYESLDLGAFSTPNNGILTYVSSDEDVVSVDASGIIKAKKAGSAIITIKFEGDKKYLPSQKQVIVSVSKIVTSINLTDMKLLSCGVYELKNIVLPDGVPTRAKYYEIYSMDTEVFDVDDGVLTTFHEGKAELYVGFKGDDIYAPCSKTVMVTVVKKVISSEDYKFTVDVNDDAQEATFTISVPEDAEGSFQVIVDGKENNVYGDAIVDGKATVIVDELSTGDHKISLRYTGDEKYESVTENTKIHIGKYKIDKNKDVDVYLGSYATYSVHLTKDTQAMQGKTITFKVNGKTYQGVTDRLGYASVNVKLPAMKTYTVTAQFGSIKVSNKIKVHVIVAKNLKTKKTKDLKVKITLKKVNKKYLSGKKVTLKFNGKVFSAKTSKTGVATFTISKSLFSKLKVGKSYKYIVKYSKDTVTKSIKIFK